MFKHFRKMTLLLFVLLIQSFAVNAAPAKSNGIDSNITLAMLNAIKVKPKLKSVSKKSNKTLPSNCMQWNSQQLKQKAKRFSKPILKYSRLYKVDSNLIKAVIAAESCFKVKALSKANARGLMQLIPATAERFGVKNSYNPEQNIRGGVKYLRFLLDRYKGNLKKVIAAYNAGEGRVDRYNGIPPFKETKRYVKNVLKTYAILSPKPSKKKTRVKAVYHPPSIGKKPGRHGWQYNRRLAPHLYKQ
ncbi:MAG: lytic transglycosylase domain-containing protein [Cocleimonas sp.]